MTRRLVLAAAALAVTLLALTGLAAAFAPQVMVALSPWLDRHEIVAAATPPLARGRMVDGYFAVQPLGEGVFAIGEPRYYQQNYAYLILGERRAVLFDAGTGTRDIRPVVAALTALPVTVIVSHLHFDHLGGAAAFGAVAMVDEPATRADLRGGRFSPSRDQWLGQVDGRPPPTLSISHWLAPGQWIDLGGRRLQVLATPGHTPSSISLWDPAGRRLFAGDFIYPTTLYAFLPGASLSAYQATARRLLAGLPADTILWTAHCCRAGEDASAPWLTMTNLADLEHTLGEVRAGRGRGHGFYPVVWPVDGQMTLATGFAWNNR